MAAGLTVGHLLVTAVAAPVNFSQRTHTGDPAALARVFDTFERLTAARTVVQAATLAAMVWALAAATNPPSRPPEPPSPPPGLRTPTAGPTASSPLMQSIDRVENAGWAPSAIAPHYQGMATAWTELLAAYSDEQLVLFLDLFDRIHQLSQQQLASLDYPTPSSDTATS